MNLFSQGILSKLELVLLVKDLLWRYPDLLESFKSFIGFDSSKYPNLGKLTKIIILIILLKR